MNFPILATFSAMGSDLCLSRQCGMPRMPGRPLQTSGLISIRSVIGSRGGGEALIFGLRQRWNLTVEGVIVNAGFQHETDERAEVGGRRSEVGRARRPTAP